VIRFIISIAIGVPIALVWMGIWALVLRAFGIPVLMRTPEERTARKQRILQMGKLLGGCFNGMKAWSQLFRTEVPFPPLYPPSK
jgi:hypothetical protein